MTHPKSQSGRQPTVIFGSCVSRDCLNTTSASEHFDLRAYFARSSISSFAAAGREIRKGDIRLDSDFQRRQVEADISSSFLNFQGIRDSILILDLIDERFDLARTGNTILTLSRELDNSGFLSQNRHRKINSDSGESQQLWRNGLQKFAAAIKKNCPSKVVIHKAYWCTRFRNEEGIIESFPEKTIALSLRHNAKLEQQYEELLRSLPGCSTIDLFQQDDFCSDSQHRWGISPFHYENRYYDEMIQRLLAITEQEQS